MLVIDFSYNSFISTMPVINSTQVTHIIINNNQLKGDLNKIFKYVNYWN